MSGREDGRTAASSIRRGVRTGIILMGVGVALGALWLAREVVLLGFLGVVVAVVLSFPVNWLAGRVRRGMAIIVVLLVLAGGAFGLANLAAPTLSRQFDRMSENAPRAIHEAERWLRRVGAPARSAGGGSAGQVAPAVANAAEKAVPALVGIVSGVTAVILVIVLGAFLAYGPQAYVAGVRRLVPPSHRGTYDELVTRVGDGLRRWVGGVLVSMAIMGALTASALAFAGIQDWLLLGVLTFLGTFVPYLGAIASAVPGLIMALAQSPRHFALAAAIYVGVHLVEGYIVQPLIMKRAVELRPALLLAGESALGAMLGLTGIVVATPLLVCIQIAVQYLWVERHLQKSLELARSG